MALPIVYKLFLENFFHEDDDYYGENSKNNNNNNDNNEEEEELNPSVPFDKRKKKKG